MPKHKSSRTALLKLWVSSEPNNLSVFNNFLFCKTYFSILHDFIKLLANENLCLSQSYSLWKDSQKIIYNIHLVLLL